MYFGNTSQVDALLVLLIRSYSGSFRISGLDAVHKVVNILCEKSAWKHTDFPGVVFLFCNNYDVTGF